MASSDRGVVLGSDLAKEVAEETGLSLRQSKRALGIVFDSMIAGLLHCGRIKITNFGTFWLITKVDSRKGLVRGRYKIAFYKPPMRFREIRKTPPTLPVLPT